jgi:hypothetical protein
LLPSQKSKPAENGCKYPRALFLEHKPDVPCLITPLNPLLVFRIPLNSPHARKLRTTP